MEPQSVREVCEQAINRFVYYLRDCGYPRDLATEKAVEEISETAVVSEEDLETIWGLVEQQSYEDA